MTNVGTKIRIGVAGTALAATASLVSVAPAQAAPVTPVPASPVVNIAPMPTSPGSAFNIGGAPMQPWWLTQGSASPSDLLAPRVPRGWFPIPFRNTIRFVIALIRCYFGPYGTRN